MFSFGSLMLHFLFCPWPSNYSSLCINSNTSNQYATSNMEKMDHHSKINHKDMIIREHSTNYMSLIHKD